MADRNDNCYAHNTIAAMKKTPVPVPGSKPKKGLKATSNPAAAPLSKEYIGSDDESASEKRAQSKSTSKQKQKQKPQTTIAIHRPNGSTKSHAKDSKMASSSTATIAEKPSKKPAPKKIVTQEDAAELSSSDQTDGSDKPTRDIQTKLSGDRMPQRVSSDSDSESGSDSESSSDESQEAKATHTAPKSSQAPPRTTLPDSHAVEFRPVHAYVPPKGFNPVPLNSKTISKSVSAVSQLGKKQLWHITAPSGVSLKELEEIALDQAMKGQAVLEFKGTSYGFSQPEPGEDIAREVLLPQTQGYKAASTHISRTLHLRAVVPLPELVSQQTDQNTGSAAEASITRSTIRAPRPQVKGLKMRFLPSGFEGANAGTLGDSDSEVEIAASNSLDGLRLPTRQQKRKHTDETAALKIESSSKKHKSHRTLEEKQNKEERRAKKERKRAQEAALKKS